MRIKIPERMKFVIRVIVSKITSPLYYQKRNSIFYQQKKMGIRNIPIFIISFNRLSYLKQMISQLELLGLKNIYVIDNNSTYPPLLKYYDSIPYKVFRLKDNGGHMVFWNSDIFQKYRKNFYVVTDPDLQFLCECPSDFMENLFFTLKKYSFVRKVGLSLKIDDLSNTSTFVRNAIKWEQQYYKTYIKKENIFYASVDTTFAMYIPDELVKKQKFLSAFRTGYPYQVRHLPWYKNSDDITEEDLFYSCRKTNGWWDNVKGLTPD